MKGSGAVKCSLLYCTDNLKLVQQGEKAPVTQFSKWVLSKFDHLSSLVVRMKGRVGKGRSLVFM